MSRLLATLSFPSFDEILGKRRENRTTSTLSSITKQLFKAHYDGGYDMLISRNLSIDLFRAIKLTSKYQRRTPEFVASVKSLLKCLHDYNLEIAKWRSRYPRFQKFEDLLICYIELELELLYDTYDPIDEKQESKVEETLLKFLLCILYEWHNERDELQKNIMKNCYKKILIMFAKARANCIADNKIVVSVISKLVKKLEIEDELDKLKGKHVPYHADTCLQNQTAMELRELLLASDCKSDDYASEGELSNFSTNKYLDTNELLEQCEDDELSKQTQFTTFEVFNHKPLKLEFDDFDDNRPTKGENVNPIERNHEEADFDDFQIMNSNVVNENPPLTNGDLNINYNSPKQNESSQDSLLGIDEELGNNVADIDTIELSDDECVIGNSTPSSKPPELLQTNQIKLEENDENHSPNFPLLSIESNNENSNSNKTLRNSSNSSLNNRLRNPQNDSAKDDEIVISDTEENDVLIEEQVYEKPQEQNHDINIVETPNEPQILTPERILEDNNEATETTTIDEDLQLIEVREKTTTLYENVSQHIEHTETVEIENIDDQEAEIVKAIQQTDQEPLEQIQDDILDRNQGLSPVSSEEDPELFDSELSPEYDSIVNDKQIHLAPVEEVPSVIQEEKKEELQKAEYIATDISKNAAVHESDQIPEIVRREESGYQESQQVELQQYEEYEKIVTGSIAVIKESKASDEIIQHSKVVEGECNELEIEQEQVQQEIFEEPPKPELIPQINEIESNVTETCTDLDLLATSLAVAETNYEPIKPVAEVTSTPVEIQQSHVEIQKPLVYTEANFYPEIPASIDVSNALEKSNLDVLADVALIDTSIETHSELSSIPVTELIESPKRQVSKVRWGNKQQTKKAAVKAQSVENKRITRNAAKQLKSDYEDVGVMKATEYHCKPDDFMIADTTISPPTNKVYTQEVFSDANLTLPSNSDDSNDSGGKLFIGKDDDGKTFEKVVNPYDEDTIDDGLQFISTEPEAPIYISIPEQGSSNPQECFIIAEVSQYSDNKFQPPEDNAIMTSEPKEQIETSQISVSERTASLIDDKTCKPTDHSIDSILNKEPPISELPELPKTPTPNTESEQSTSEPTEHDTVPLEPEDLSLNDIHDKIMKTKAAVKSYDDKLNSEVVQSVPVMSEHAMKTRSRSKSSEILPKQPVQERQRSVSVDVKDLSVVREEAEISLDNIESSAHWSDISTSSISDKDLSFESLPPNESIEGVETTCQEVVISEVVSQDLSMGEGSSEAAPNTNEVTKEFEVKKQNDDILTKANTDNSTAPKDVDLKITIPSISLPAEKSPNSKTPIKSKGLNLENTIKKVKEKLKQEQAFDVGTASIQADNSTKPKSKSEDKLEKPKRGNKVDDKKSEESPKKDSRLDDKPKADSKVQRENKSEEKQKIESKVRERKSEEKSRRSSDEKRKRRSRSSSKSSCSSKKYEHNDSDKERSSHRRRHSRSSSKGRSIESRKDKHSESTHEKKRERRSSSKTKETKSKEDMNGHRKHYERSPSKSKSVDTKSRHHSDRSSSKTKSIDKSRGDDKNRKSKSPSKSRETELLKSSDKDKSSTKEKDKSESRSKSRSLLDEKKKNNDDTSKQKSKVLSEQKREKHKHDEKRSEKSRNHSKEKTKEESSKKDKDKSKSSVAADNKVKIIEVVSTPSDKENKDVKTSREENKDYTKVTSEVESVCKEKDSAILNLKSMKEATTEPKGKVDIASRDEEKSAKVVREVEEVPKEQHGVISAILNMKSMKEATTEPKGKVDIASRDEEKSAKVVREVEEVPIEQPGVISAILNMKSMKEATTEPKGKVDIASRDEEKSAKVVREVEEVPKEQHGVILEDKVNENDMLPEIKVTLPKKRRYTSDKEDDMPPLTKASDDAVIAGSSMEHPPHLDKMNANENCKSVIPKKRRRTSDMDVEELPESTPIQETLKSAFEQETIVDISPEEPQQPEILTPLVEENVELPPNKNDIVIDEKLEAPDVVTVGVTPFEDFLEIMVDSQKCVQPREIENLMSTCNESQPNESHVETDDSKLQQIGESLNTMPFLIREINFSQHVVSSTSISVFSDNTVDTNVAPGGPLVGGATEESLITQTGPTLTNPPADDFNSLNDNNIEELPFSDDNLIDDLRNLDCMMAMPQNENVKTSSINHNINHENSTDSNIDGLEIDQLNQLTVDDLLKLSDAQNSTYTCDISNIIENPVSNLHHNDEPPITTDDLNGGVKASSTTPDKFNMITNYMENQSPKKQKVIVETIEQLPITSINQAKINNFSTSFAENITHVAKPSFSSSTPKTKPKFSASSVLPPPKNNDEDEGAQKDLLENYIRRRSNLARPVAPRRKNPQEFADKNKTNDFDAKKNDNIVKPVASGRIRVRKDPDLFNFDECKQSNSKPSPSNKRERDSSSIQKEDPKKLKKSESDYGKLSPIKPLLPDNDRRFDALKNQGPVNNIFNPKKPEVQQASHNNVKNEKKSDSSTWSYEVFDNFFGETKFFDGPISGAKASSKSTTDKEKPTASTKIFDNKSESVTDFVRDKQKQSNKNHRSSVPNKIDTDKVFDDLKKQGPVNEIFLNRKNAYKSKPNTPSYVSSNPGYNTCEYQEMLDRQNAKQQENPGYFTSADSQETYRLNKEKSTSSTSNISKKPPLEYFTRPHPAISPDRPEKDDGRRNKYNGF